MDVEKTMTALKLEPGTPVIIVVKDSVIPFEREALTEWACRRKLDILFIFGATNDAITILDEQQMAERGWIRSRRV